MSHFLIADSGSTKTNWALISFGNDEPVYFETPGYNPYFWEKKNLVDSLRTTLQLPVNPAHIFFYGAGCSSKPMSAFIKEAIVDAFDTHVDVYHDMLGTCRALFGTGEGIAGILGTGSNSCAYDGKNISEQIPSLGFILGDEGSGGHIGKTFVKAYLDQQLPHDLVKVAEDCGLELEGVLGKVYKEALPNRYLASFTKVVGAHIDHPFCNNLVRTSFRSFFEGRICRYQNFKNKPVGITGSVADAFSDILREVAAEFGLKEVRIMKDPLPGLIIYHQQDLPVV